MSNDNRADAPQQLVTHSLTLQWDSGQEDELTFMDLVISNDEKGPSISERSRGGLQTKHFPKTEVRHLADGRLLYVPVEDDDTGKVIDSQYKLPLASAGTVIMDYVVPLEIEIPATDPGTRQINMYGYDSKQSGPAFAVVVAPDGMIAFVSQAKYVEMGLGEMPYRTKATTPVLGNPDPATDPS